LLHCDVLDHIDSCKLLSSVQGALSVGHVEWLMLLRATVTAVHNALDIPVHSNLDFLLYYSTMCIQIIPFWIGNLAMSFTAISTLICLGDDLSRLDKSGIISGARITNTHLLVFYLKMRSDR
jgi:hypothetical protein